MSKYRNRLPQLREGLFATDAGLETTLIFHRKLELPHFAAFDLLKDETSTAVLRDYFQCYTDIAVARGLGLVLESATWRASRDWGARLGYDEIALADANRRSIGLLLEIRAKFESPSTPIVISGNIGPRGDGYRPTSRMTALEAAAYHAPQIDTFESTDADMIAAFTMNYIDEAVGITTAAKSAGVPIAVSFTLQTNGNLPSGDTLAQAIQRTDDETDGYPAYYMINCAHPTHFEHLLDGSPWTTRVRGIRANASRRSHLELDESTDLDEGDPDELADQYRMLFERLPALAVVGGCCGTDHRHVAAICSALTAGRKSTAA
ncbi:MAG: homocysteine S-methyltransferase family protein [Steroidobacteraceae bacterium]